MSTPDTTALPPHPKRADARRNREKLLAAARAAFAEEGTGASLEEVARRADVGIGTLYRNFPTRQHLLEAVYVEEIEAMARSAAELAELEPWDALETWLRRYAGFAATKKALAEELTDRNAAVFQSCRMLLTEAGTELVERAQRAGAVRPDTSFLDMVRLVTGIVGIAAEREEIERLLGVALDGLRYRG